jgi:DNA-directed RNA polymerase subunit alpha
MTQKNQKFFSYIESRVQETGELYARFHLGSFVAGQALTVANALRRTLLAEIPGVVVTNVQIEGANHEFATLPGVQENVLNIVLNLKKMVLTIKKNHFKTITKQRQELLASINISGPAKVTAGDIKFPSGIIPVDPDHLIANLGTTGTLKMDIGIQFIDPLKSDQVNFPNSNLRIETQKILVNALPNPVRQVNYSIRQLDNGTGNSFTDVKGDEYISLEIWTDGSVDPKYTLECALERLTKMFYTFSCLNKDVFESKI